MKFSAALSLLSVATSSGFVAHQSNAGRQSLTELYERKPFITGNWKLNPQSKQEAIDLATGVADAVTSDSPCDVAVFVPFPFMEAVQKVVGNKLVVGAEVRTILKLEKKHQRILPPLCSRTKNECLYSFADGHSRNGWGFHWRNFCPYAKKCWCRMGTCWSF